VFLKFRRHLNVEGNEFDHAKIYVSANGTGWTQVWENPPIDLMDSQWVPVVLDISSIAANQATVYIKFTMWPTNSSRRFSGWSIDDLEVTSEAIYPSEGTYGTELMMTGSGFASKKGKVLMGGTSLSILDWADDLVCFRLSKVLPLGIHDVMVQPGEPKGAPSIVKGEGFIVRPPEIHAIEEGEGTAYDQITIKGKFFGTKKGEVYLEYEEEGEKIRKCCKVTKWWMDPITNESEIFFIVPKMLPEVCDVVVDPYSTLEEVEGEGGFTVKAPEIGLIEPVSASVGEQITILGNFFGSKKPKVYFGYVSNRKPKKKSCSVQVGRGNDEIVFTVPKLPLGTYDVIVTNSVSSDTLAGGFIMPGHTEKIESPWLTPKEAAPYCRISLSLFNQKRRQLNLKRGGTPRRPRFHKDELDYWMNKRFTEEMEPENNLRSVGNPRGGLEYESYKSLL